jgi:hypothetical protein
VSHDEVELPFTEEKIRALKVGDEVLLSGVGFIRRGIGRLNDGISLH